MEKLDGYKFELTTGLLTGLFGLVNFLFAILTSFYAAKPLNNLRDFVTTVFCFLGIPLLVATGSYVHVVKQSFGGLIMIVIGAFLSIIITCFIFLAAAFAGYSSLLLMVALAPYLMGMVTLIVSIIEKFNRTKPISSSTPGNLST